MLDTFEERGEVCGVYENPGDWCLDLVCGNEENVRRLVDLERVKSKSIDGHDRDRDGILGQKKDRRGANDNHSASSGKGESPIWIALPILLHRGWLAFKRYQTIPEARIGNVFGLAVRRSFFYSCKILREYAILF
jgi:hypothetical protein